MFSAANVSDQPVFYLFIAATILLSLGYIWGRRRNHRITHTAFKALSTVLNPKDQTFTNIGGLTGYHAHFIPQKSSGIKEINATLTLLPRQSWLWYPFSLIIRRFDRLSISCELGKKASRGIREGHLIERKYSTFAGARIQNVDDLKKDTLTWGTRTFYLYYADAAVKREMERCKEMVGADPGPLRHVALVPERSRLFVFLIPVPDHVERVVGQVYGWFTSLSDMTVSDTELSDTAQE